MVDRGRFEFAGEVDVAAGENEAALGVVEFLDDLAELAREDAIVEMASEVVKKEDAVDGEVFDVAQGGEGTCGRGEDGVAGGVAGETFGDGPGEERQLHLLAGGGEGLANAFFLEGLDDDQGVEGMD